MQIMGKLNVIKDTQGHIHITLSTHYIQGKLILTKPL